MSSEQVQAIVLTILLYPAIHVFTNWLLPYNLRIQRDEKGRWSWRIERKKQ